MATSDHYDVIVVGTGAGGGTLAHTVAASGKRVLLLERGDFLPREMENWSPEPVFVDGRYISHGHLVRRRRHSRSSRRSTTSSAAPPSSTAPRCTACARRTSARSSHVDGVSPAWPLTYDDFEPWYTKAEWLYQVHGNHGEDPTEGHWSKQYPWPAVSHEPRIQEITDALAAGGYHPFSAPCGILLDEADRARSTCIRCTWCDGYPCLVHAKSDAETIAVRPLLDAAQRHAARRRRGDSSSRPTRPAAPSPASWCRVAAPRRSTPPTSSSCRPARRTAPSCCCARPTTAHPNGLANGSDQVGRNYMFHNSKAVVALAKERNDTVFQKTLGINDFYLGDGDGDWPLGNIQMVGKSNGWAMKGEEPKLTKLAPHWSLDDVARHAVDFWLTTEDLPTPDNRVTVDDDGNIHLAYTSNNDGEADRLYHELRKILNHIGMAQHHVLDKNFYMKMNIPVAGVAHQAGTCRFGDRSGDVGARRRLQGPRARQPLRRRHQLLPEHRRREPGAHGDGQRHPRRRAPRRTPRDERCADGRRRTHARRGLRPARERAAGTPATGTSGARTSASGSGARSARTTAPTATRGRTSRTTTPARAPTGGARTAWPASATSSSGCASRWRCGTAATRSSRSGCSASPAPRPTTARTSRSTGGTSTPFPSHALEPLALPLPAGGVPVRRPDRRERPAGQARPGVRAARHRRVRRRPLLDRRGRLRQGRPRRPAHGRPGHQRRARRRRRCTCCRRRGSATRGPGTTTRRSRACAARPTAPSRSTTRSCGELELLAGPGPDGTAPTALFCENETNDRPPVRLRLGPRRTRRTASTTTSCTGRRHRQPRPEGHEGRRSGTGSRSPPGETAELRLRLRPVGTEPRDAVVGARHGLRRVVAAAPQGGRRVLRRADPGRPLGRRGGGHAPGVRRDAVEQAALRLRRAALARRRPDPAGAAGRRG